MFKDLVRKNRSYRRFYEDETISLKTLRELIDLARLCPSGGNLQPIKYVLVNNPKMTDQVFSRLGWAHYLKDWSGPEKGERPSAYIVVLLDKKIELGFAKEVLVDHGIMSQTMLLGAVEKGLGGCMIATINRKGLAKDLDLPQHYEILLVLALGKPKETVQVDDLSQGGNVQYWRDEKAVHHVPKRITEDLIFAEKGN